MSGRRRPLTPEELARATDISGLDPELFENEPTARSLDAANTDV